VLADKARIVKDQLSLSSASSPATTTLSSSSTLSPNNSSNRTEDPPGYQSSTIGVAGEWNGVNITTMKFSRHSELTSFFSKYASTMGFIIVDRQKGFFKEQDLDKYFPTNEEEVLATTTTTPTTAPTTTTANKMPYRGYFYCSPKSYNSKYSPCQSCPFKACYLWCGNEHKFIIRSQSNFQHNHHLRSALMVLDGVEHVNYEHFLTYEETTMIRDQSIARVSMPQLKINLEEMFPHRTYDKPLLYRMRKKFFDAKYGSDGHNIQDLFVKGDMIKVLGGKFVVQPSSDSFCFKSIHCQTKLMGEYADVFGRDGFRMADGTHKITQHDWTFIFWMVIDNLLGSKFVGYTANFSENTAVIVEGAEIFFPFDAVTTTSLPDASDGNHVCIGGIPGHFDPFVDTPVNLGHPPAPKDTQCDSTTATLTGNGHPPMEAWIDDLTCHGSGSVIKSTNGFMTDEGSAFPGVAEHYGWTHLLDRRHFAPQIISSWHGIQDPAQFKGDIYAILDCPESQNMEALLATAIETYTSAGAQMLLMKISSLKHKLCYCYTCKTFTAGHVSDQRSEGGMACMKAMGKLTKYLAGCTFGEAVARISQVAREHDLLSIKELIRCREKNMKVGEKYLDPSHYTVQLLLSDRLPPIMH
jgi:hypothetical protein